MKICGYDCENARDVWYALMCVWRTSRLRQLLFYFSRSERACRWHFARARQLGCDVYCVSHACDAKECANDPVHAD